jgi:hypothetical protein
VTRSISLVRQSTSWCKEIDTQSERRKGDLVLRRTTGFGGSEQEPVDTVPYRYLGTAVAGQHNGLTLDLRSVRSGTDREEYE